MKKIVSIILSIFMLLTVLTSCDFVDSVIEKFKPTAETTTTEPSTTTTEPETSTTAQPEDTTTKPEDTTTKPEDTTTDPDGGDTNEPEINYGTLSNPVTTTYAYGVCAGLANGESSAYAFFVKGKVTAIGSTGNYYKNVYITDGDTELLIYTINMSGGITGFSVGDTIVAYGYIKNYQGTIEMATYNGSEYVYVMKVESAGGSQGGGNQDDNTSDRFYSNFDTDEKELFLDSVGLVIPFIPNDEYYVDSYAENDESGVNFYTFGNTQAEFDAYRALFSDYSFDGTNEDEYGDTWYFYSKGDVYVDMTFYYYEGAYVVDIYVYVIDYSGSAGGNPDDGNPSDYFYNDFSADEKELFVDYFGFVIPFIPNDEYYVEEYAENGEVGIFFYTIGNTQAEFDAYRALFSSYTYDGTDNDDYGDAWYYYSKGDVLIDMSFYYYEGDYFADIYVYTLSDDTDSGNTNADIITNEGAGLPQSPSGVYDVDFTKGEYIQDVTDQAEFLGGCPATGSPAVLVIPVEFSDITAESKGYTIDRIESVFTGSDNCYYSVYDYFYISSYGKLDLDITIIDTWFRPAKSSSYYENATVNYGDGEMEIGDQLIIDEALAYLATIMDLSQFDSDGNGLIDAVIIVNTLDIKKEDFHWAYRYWNYYTDANDEYYEYDGVVANDYMWLSYEFVFEAYDENYNPNFDTSNPLNPFTFIHEFSHVIGAIDYYDEEHIKHPLDGHDVMDNMWGDHNPYTKFNYGWITTSKLIVTDSTITVDLEAFEKNGDTIILANNWDESLGAYQEYYAIMYYTMTGLNAGDAGYFARDGILVYHINASLYEVNDNGEIYYSVYNNNTDPSGEYGTEDNLVEFVFSEEGNYTYVAGESMPTTTDDNGNVLGYTFVIDSLTAEYATITFTKK